MVCGSNYFFSVSRNQNYAQEILIIQKLRYIAISEFWLNVLVAMVYLLNIKMIYISY